MSPDGLLRGPAGWWGGPRIVAAFRAYKWNDDIAVLAERFFASCPGARHVVLMNEAYGPVDAGRHEKVSHGEDFSGLGLPERPLGRSLWFNGDYAYIHLRQALPDHDLYVIAESDVAVNLSLGPMLQAVLEDGIDAVLHDIHPVHPDWVWHDAARAQRDPLQAFLFLCVFSGRALDALLAGRRTLAACCATDPDHPWPLCESFVPTVLREQGMRVAGMAAYADTARLRYRPFVKLDDPRAGRPGTLVHPVLGPRDFARSMLSHHAPQDYFVRGSMLQRALADQKLDEILPPLHSAFVLCGDHAGAARVAAIMRASGLPPPVGDDLAYCKPALTSSLSAWSRDNCRARDANGANGVVVHDLCAFHTAREADAWWMVDLLEPCRIDAVQIVNRVAFEHRFRRFVVETADAAAAIGEAGEAGKAGPGPWTVQLTKRSTFPVSSDLEAPWSGTLDRPVVARFLRIRRIGLPDFLHLRRVRVLGAPVRPDGRPEPKPVDLATFLPARRSMDA